MRLTLTVPADPKWLDMIRDVATRMAETAGLERGEAARIGQQVSEAARREVDRAGPGQVVAVSLAAAATGLEVHVEARADDSSPWCTR